MVTERDRGLVEMPMLAPDLCFDALDDGTIILRSEVFDTALHGACYADLLPLLDGRRPRREIIARLAGKHPATDVQTALVLLAKSGYVVSGEFDMDAKRAALWSVLGVSPRWAEQRLSATPVSVFGDDGRLAAHLAEMGFGIGLGEAALSVLACSDYLDEELSTVNLRKLASRTPWTLVRSGGALPMFGPIFRPGGACWECLAVRLRANRAVEGFLRASAAPVAVSRPVDVGTSALTEAVHGLAALEIAKWVVLGDLSPLDGGAITLEPNGLEIEHHWVGRRPQCRACGDASMSRPDRAPVPLKLKPSPKSVRNSGGTRAVPQNETLGRFRRLVSPVCGVVTRLERVTDAADPWLHVYAATSNAGPHATTFRGLRNRVRREQSAGKGSTPQQSEASALCEAIERFSGTFTGGEIRFKKRLSDFLRSGTDEAIHPNEVELFSDRQLDTPERSVTPDETEARRVPLRFDPDSAVSWSPMWSLTRRSHRFLPTALLYRGVPRVEGGAFCWATTNGCAAGNTLEEAVLQGFLELVERDSVAIWWYNRLRLPAVDLDSFGDEWLTQARNRYRAWHRDLWVLDATLDLGIPAFVSVSRRIANEGGERILYGFGAHIDPRIAALRAVCEMNQVLPAFGDPESDDAEFRSAWLGRWLREARLADHPHLAPDGDAAVRRMTDYAVPDTEDVREDIEHCQRLMEGRGLEVLVLDQTRPDVGMPVARVIVPGLRHYYQRFAPGRLYDVPVQVGRLDSPLAEADLNCAVIAG